MLTAATGKKRERLCLLCLAAAFLAISPETGGAQTSDAGSGASGPPARIGNHYNYKAYQPTTGEVCDGVNSAGVDCPSRSGKDAAAKLDDIRRRLDELNKQYPPVPSSGVSDHER